MSDSGEVEEPKVSVREANAKLSLERDKQVRSEAGADDAVIQETSQDKDTEQRQ